VIVYSAVAPGPAVRTALAAHSREPDSAQMLSRRARDEQTVMTGSPGPLHAVPGHAYTGVGIVSAHDPGGMVRGDWS
jgi:hypothetical protein